MITNAIVWRHARLAVGLDVQPADHFAERIHGLSTVPDMPGCDTSFMARTRELRGLVGVR